MSDPVELKILCAGAAKGLVEAVRAQFASAHGASISARFGAVGSMKEALLAGEPCDLMIVTAPMIDSLAEGGYLDGASRLPIGRVRTGVAVRSGEAIPDISTAAALKSLLLATEGLYFPDPARSTAGIHFAGVLRKLELHSLLESRFRTHPDGAAAMRALASSREPRLAGCTQVTEIIYTDGVSLAGPLPQAFELATVYAAAVTGKAAEPHLARLLMDVLAGDDTAQLRIDGGFEPA